MALTQKSKASGKGSAALSVKATAKNAIVKGKSKALPPPAPKAKSPKPTEDKHAKVAQAKAALKKVNVKAVEVEAPPTPAPLKVAPVVEKPKKAGKSRKLSIDIAAGESVSALAQKWGTLYKKAEQIEAKPYNMRAEFVEKTAIVHKILGWGYILANRNDRLEVLFKDGIKYLISNYKP